jgi:hypothetical protein
MTEGGGTFIEDMDAGKVDPRDSKQPDREIKEVRATDIEPYTGLRYLSKLFRFMAVILVMLLIAEIATGLYTQGSAAVPTLLGEASRLIVLAGVLWGTGDLAHLLIDVGHDVRAARILASRAAAKGGLSSSLSPTSTPRSSDRSRTDVAFSDRPVPRQNMPKLGDSGDDTPPIP